MDSGTEHSLAREIHFCGLISQIDVPIGEPLGSALHRVPLNSHIYNATLRNSGSYVPLLQVASPLETDNGADLRTLCQECGMELNKVTRALLRALVD